MSLDADTYKGEILEKTLRDMVNQDQIIPGNQIEEPELLTEKSPTPKQRAAAAKRDAAKRQRESAKRQRESAARTRKAEAARKASARKQAADRKRAEAARNKAKRAQAAAARKRAAAQKATQRRSEAQKKKNAAIARKAAAAQKATQRRNEAERKKRAATAKREAKQRESAQKKAASDAKKQANAMEKARKVGPNSVKTKGGSRVKKKPGKQAASAPEKIVKAYAGAVAAKLVGGNYRKRVDIAGGALRLNVSHSKKTGISQSATIRTSNKTGLGINYNTKSGRTIAARGTGIRWGPKKNKSKNKSTDDSSPRPEAPDNPSAPETLRDPVERDQIELIRMQNDKTLAKLATELQDLTRHQEALGTESGFFGGKDRKRAKLEKKKNKVAKLYNERREKLKKIAAKDYKNAEKKYENAMKPIEKLQKKIEALGDESGFFGGKDRKREKLQAELQKNVDIATGIADEMDSLQLQMENYIHNNINAQKNFDILFENHRKTFLT